MSRTKTKREVNMLSGSIIPELLKYAFPIILTGVLQQLYSTADTLVVGSMGGKEALAAVGATGSTIGLLVTVFTNIFIGTNILVARFVGTKDEESLKKTVSTTYVMSIIFGVFLLVVGELLAVPLLNLTECPENILPGAEKYLRIYFIGIPASMFMNFGASVIRSSGDSRSPFIYMSLSGIVNVVCNVLFVLVLGDAVAAVAIATVVSMYLSAILFFVHLVKENGALKLNPFKFEFSPYIFGKTMRYGIPAAISSITFSLTNFIIQPAVNSYGDVALSGTAAACSIEAYIYVITSALGGAVGTFMGQNMGAGNRDRVKHVLITGYILNISVMAVFTAVVLGFGHELLWIFIPGETEALEFAYLRLTMIVGAAVLNGIMNINSGALQAYGYTVLQMISNLVGVCLFRIVWMWAIYPAAPSEFNLLVCYPISWGFSAVAVFVMVVILSKKYFKGKEFKI